MPYVGSVPKSGWRCAVRPTLLTHAAECADATACEMSVRHGLLLGNNGHPARVGAVVSAASTPRPDADVDEHAVSASANSPAATRLAGRVTAGLSRRRHGRGTRRPTPQP